MPRIKLNQRFADQACPIVGRKKTEWFDVDLKGFYLEVRDTGGKTYRLRVLNEDGKPRVINLGDAACVSFESAKTRAKELRAAAQIGQWHYISQKPKSAATQMTLARFVEEKYLPYARARKRSIETDISVLNNHLLPSFGEMPISEISKSEIIEFHTRKREAGYAPGTADRMIVLLRFMFNLAIKWEILPRGSNPADQFEFFNESNARERYLSQEEVKRLIAELRKSENPDLLNIVTALLFTGCRRGEILNAKWVDIDFDRLVWTIPLTKQGKPHRLPITSELRQFLSALPSKGNSDFLFPSRRTGKPYKAIFYSWDRARQNAGMPELRIHDLRHSFASFLVNGGRSLYEVQKLLGHTSSRTTQRYAHLSNDSLASALAVAERAVDMATSSGFIPAIEGSEV